MGTPSEGDLQEKIFMLGTVFKPTAPINREDLFAGRQAQTRDVVDAINQQGQHAVLFGERGVGKTSLANMIFPSLRSTGSPIIAPQINCMTSDNYEEIWKRVFEEILFKVEVTRATASTGARRSYWRSTPDRTLIASVPTWSDEFFTDSASTESR